VTSYLKVMVALVYCTCTTQMCLTIESNWCQLLDYVYTFLKLSITTANCNG